MLQNRVTAFFTSASFPVWSNVQIAWGETFLICKNQEKTALFCHVNFFKWGDKSYFVHFGYGRSIFKSSVNVTLGVEEMEKIYGW